jgi:hypothetical protein
MIGWRLKGEWMGNRNEAVRDNVPISRHSRVPQLSVCASVQQYA